MKKGLKEMLSNVQDPQKENSVLESEVVVKMNNVKKYFPIKGGLLRKTVGNVKAVDDISLEIRKGETLGLVGESGCGKSTLGRVLVRLLEPTDGEIFINGTNITNYSNKEMRTVRKKIQMVFQDPFSSLNGKMSVQELIEEPLLVQTKQSKKERIEKVEEMIQKVGLRVSDLGKYPHEFSGGQRQRISIARALILNPDIVVYDEAVSALDVSIQAQVLNLMKDLQKELNLTYLFISHDLNVVGHMSDRVAVMYLGKVVEIGKNDRVYNHQKHPYTKFLLDSIPEITEEPDLQKKASLSGDLPSPANPPSGCTFRTRCPFAFDRCSEEVPLLKEVEDDHFAACHLNDKQN